MATRDHRHRSKGVQKENKFNFTNTFKAFQQNRLIALEAIPSRHKHIYALPSTLTSKTLYKQ